MSTGRARPRTARSGPTRRPAACGPRRAVVWRPHFWKFLQQWANSWPIKVWYMKWEQLRVSRIQQTATVFTTVTWHIRLAKHWTDRNTSYTTNVVHVQHLLSTDYGSAGARKIVLGGQALAWGTNTAPPSPPPSLPSLSSPSLPYVLLPFPSTLVPSPPLRSRPPKIQLGAWGSAVSSPSGVWGEAPADKRFGAF